MSKETEISFREELRKLNEALSSTKFLLQQISHDFKCDEDRVASISEYRKEKREFDSDVKQKERYRDRLNTLKDKKKKLLTDNKQQSSSKNKKEKLPLSKRLKARFGKIKYRGGQAISATGKGVKAVGKGLKAAGKGLILTSKALKIAAKTLSAVAKAMRTAGRVIMQGGLAMIKAGAALCGTGIGAIAGVPMIAAGAAMAATGVATMVASIPVSAASIALNVTSKTLHISGKVLEKSGNALAKVGQKIKIRGNQIKVNGNNMYRDATGRDINGFSLSRTANTSSKTNDTSDSNDNNRSSNITAELAGIAIGMALADERNKKEQDRPLSENRQRISDNLSNTPAVHLSSPQQINETQVSQNQNISPSSSLADINKRLTLSGAGHTSVAKRFRRRFQRQDPESYKAFRHQSNIEPLLPHRTPTIQRTIDPNILSMGRGNGGLGS